MAGDLQATCCSPEREPAPGGKDVEHVLPALLARSRAWHARVRQFVNQSYIGLVMFKPDRF